MVRTLQVKFVKTAMIAITVLLLAVICAISGIYSASIYREAKWTAQMLAEHGGVPAFDDMSGAGRDEDDWDFEDWGSEYEDDEDPYADSEADEAQPEGTVQEESGPRPPKGEKNAWDFFFKRRMSPDDAMSVRYFIVTYNSDNTIGSTNTDRIYSVSDEEARGYGLKASQRGKQSGIIEDFFYYIAEKEDGKTAAFIDISSQISGVLSVIVISLIIAAIAWILMLVFVSALSRRAIAPIAENIIRQKQFVTNAGHELKTPLAIIMANTEALELFNGENKWTRNIKEQTGRLSVLMQNLLTLSKMDEADLNLPMQDFDLGELIRETAAPFEEPARKKNLEFHIQAPPVTVKADRNTMGQLIGILLDNAVKYTPEGGEISVSVFREGKTVTVKQKNTVRAEDIEENPEKLFDRFYRRDEARTQKKGGYGIGLSAARAIAAANHAEIGVRYEEQSIVFTVTLMI